MKLENQVVSLELAKRLASLGVSQDSIFQWRVQWETGKEDEIMLVQGENYESKGENGGVALYAAFTVAELGEILPDTIEENEATLYLMCGKGTSAHPWSIWYGSTKQEGPSSVGENEADARAALLVYLIENKLIASPN